MRAGRQHTLLPGPWLLCPRRAPVDGDGGERNHFVSAAGDTGSSCILVDATDGAQARLSDFYSPFRCTELSTAPLSTGSAVGGRVLPHRSWPANWRWLTRRQPSTTRPPRELTAGEPQTGPRRYTCGAPGLRGSPAGRLRELSPMSQGSKGYNVAWHSRRALRPSWRPLRAG